MYWTPPIRPLDPPLLKSDDLDFREPRDIGPPPFKNPGHAPEASGDTCLRQSTRSTRSVKPKKSLGADHLIRGGGYGFSFGIKLFFQLAA